MNADVSPPASGYRNTQRAPLCVMLYVMAVGFFAIGVAVWNETPLRWLFPVMGGMMLVLASSFHHLTVEDQGDRLSIHFGPLRVFRRSVRYEEIDQVEAGRTTVLEGWGIHLSHRGGWVWNLWGRDCVVLRLRRGILRVGTDDPDGLLAFLRQRLQQN